MALNVKFLKGTASQYAGLANKNADTFYYISDENKLYLGTIELSNTNIDDKIGNLSSLNTTAKNTLVAAINEVLANEGALSSLTTTAKNTLVAAINELKGRIDANDVKIGTIADLETEATNLVGAVNEVKKLVDNLENDSKVTLSSATTTTGMLKSYTISQGGKEVGIIDIPKDLVVESGRIVKNPTGQPEGTYIELTIANKTSDKIYINVADLIDIYTAQQSATQIQLAISATNEISATIVAGSITATELASNAVTTVKIADLNVTTAKIAADAITNAKLADDAVQTENIVDKNVTKAKLEQDVQDTLDLADSAVQSVVEGDGNGQIKVDGTNINVHGLGSAAYTNSNEYDKAGDADAALTAAKAYTDAALTWGTIA